MRKVKQIQPMVGTLHGKEYVAFFALCEDGTMWMANKMEEEKLDWLEIPGIPDA